MTARESIQDAYSGTLRTLFDDLLAAYVGARGDAALKQQQNRVFLAGVSVAVAVRDRAAELLPLNA